MPAIRFRPKYWFLLSLAYLRYWVGGDPPLTVADIDADTGKGPPVDRTGSTVYASGEEFLADLMADKHEYEYAESPQ